MLIRTKPMALGVAAVLLTSSAGLLAASPFDGIYVGTQRETVNNNSGYCMNINRDDFRRVVKDGMITTEWSKATLQAKIGSDGSFSANAEGMQFGRAGSNPNPITFTGTIRNGQLEADVGGAYCAAHWSMHKS